MEHSCPRFIAGAPEGDSGSVISRIPARLFFRLDIVMAILLTIHTLTAYAQSSAVYLVTYVEVSSNSVGAATVLLDRYGAASRQENGNLRFDLLHEVARPDRFAILEAWRDKSAVDGHSNAASTLQFREGLKAIQSAPYDERVDQGLFVGPVKSGSPAGTVYVLTHVDIAPEHGDNGRALLKTMRADSAAEQGNLSYEVLQQVNRPNHLTVVEEWASMRALDIHIMAPHTHAFREALLPMEGALYDERRYERLQ
jgi:quinol monooxygenase YgiN